MRTGWWWLVGVLVILSVLLRQNLLFLMALLLALVGGASMLWGRYCLSEVTYQRRLGSTRLFLGDETTLDTEITNAKPLPLPWLRAQDGIPEQIEIEGQKLLSGHRLDRRLLVNLVSLRWYERVTRHYRLRAVKRGAWQFGPAQITAEDIFGFSVRSKEIEGTQTLLVYPKIVPLTVLGLPAQHPFGDFRTPLRVMEDPIRLMGARDYAPGDNYRYIHWKASARQTSLQTKVFEPSASRPLAIFLNINTYEHVWEGLDTPLQELAITTAASLARYAWDNSYRLGLYVNSVTYPGGERIRINPGSRPDQLMWVLEALAKVVEYGRWPLEAIMEIESADLPFGTTVVVITARVNDALTRTLFDLRRREYGVVLVTLGEARLDAPPPGIVYYHAGGREAWHELESIHLA